MLNKALITVVLEIMIVPVFADDISKGTCRDRDGLMLTVLEFKISTCAMCYFYLIKEDPKYFPVHGCREENNKTLCLYERNSRKCYCPSRDNKTSAAIIEDTIRNENDVKQWRSCCQEAEKCCQQQLAADNIKNKNDSVCPKTWDGWLCWNDTFRGQTVTQQCPEFLGRLDTKEHASKICNGNATWWRDQETGREKTDFSLCLSQDVLDRLQFHKDTTIVSLAFNTFGIILLIPAIIIFIIYRNLRHQNRIKLHIHLFVSLLMSGVAVMCWDVIIKYDRIVNEGKHSIIQEHQNICKTLNMIEHYCRSTTYFWMLCEGFYLHRLLVKAFVPPKRLVGYYLTGWGVPLVIAGIYAGFRAHVSDSSSSCWIDPVSGQYHGLEWILFAPTILCIVLNLFFLLNIIRILIRQLVHPKEPTNYRKAVKATFVLIPLLGIHQFFTIYRPLPGEDGYFFFTMTGTIIYNSQAVVICCIFCYFNGEVLSHLKSSWHRLNKTATAERKSFATVLTSRRPSAVSMGSNIIRIQSRNAINDNVALEQRESDVATTEPNINNSYSNGIVNNGFVNVATSQL